MANYYTRGVIEIDCPTREAALWLLEAVDAIEERMDQGLGEDESEEDFEDYGDIDYEPHHWGFASHLEPDGKTVWLESEENCNTDALLQLLMRYLEKWEPDTLLSFELAYTVSKSLPDGWGGVGFVVTKYNWYAAGSGSWTSVVVDGLRNCGPPPEGSTWWKDVRAEIDEAEDDEAKRSACMRTRYCIAKTSDLIESGHPDYWLEWISHQSFGSELLMEIEYEVVAMLDKDEFLVRVTGDVSGILDLDGGG